MSRIHIIEDRCKGCLLCTEACPKNLLRQSAHFNRQGYQIAECVDPDETLCTGCSSCAIMCPDMAIRVFRPRRKKKGQEGDVA